MTATIGGLVIGGRVVPVEGMRIDNFLTNPKLRLSARDYTKRGPGNWPRQFVMHSTKGEWPQTHPDGVGPPLAADQVVASWNDDPEHSGAHGVFDGDSGICCADLQLDACYHATTANDHSVGFEMYQEHGGAIRKATIANTVRATLVAMTAMNLPLQMISDTYVDDRIVERLKMGGPNFVGIYGHRDQAWKFPWQLTEAPRARFPHGYASRGRGDPGDAIYQAFKDAGVELLHCASEQDLKVWARRQIDLQKRGLYAGRIDGIAGPATMFALKRAGFSCGRDLDSHLLSP